MSDLLHMFNEYKTKKVALYGLGVETQKVLPQFEQAFQVIGLLDGYKEEGELYGHPILPFAEVLNQQVELIVVVARPGSCKAIAKRVGMICRENNIALMDIRGNNLLEEQRITYDFKGVNGFTKEELLQKIEEYDVVSFDLFDTLIMRKTLFSTDVYEIVEGRLKQQGMEKEGFAGKRLECEKSLAKKGSLTLTEIYQYMLKEYHIDGISAETLADMEWSADLELLAPRTEMCELVTQIYRSGKEVYIVSDTYYTKEQLKNLLDRYDVEVTDILSSCEFGTSKTQELYSYLKNRIGNQSCLHIGDDSVADVDWAARFGLDTCKIYSGLELLEAVGYMGMWECIETLADRIKAGMFVATIFNSPFQFESQERKIAVKAVHDIGYLFAAPVITDFVIWFDKMVQKYRLPNVWMGARDGYLLKKLYDYLKKEEASTYFLTSRMAAIRAGMQSTDDIMYVADMNFTGSLEEQLAVRFGIETTVQGKKSLLDFRDEILGRSAILRKNYQKYIDGIDIKEGAIAFFDFVAKGTTQLYLSKLTEHPLQGLYFLQLEEEYMRKYGLDIEAFYSVGEKDKSTIFEDYYILETILTSSEPSVNEFGADGNPIFAKETRNREDLQCVLKVQQGIYDYFVTFLNLCPDVSNAENKRLDELMLGLLHKLDVRDSGFLKLKVEDPFFNRNTEMMDLV